MCNLSSCASCVSKQGLLRVAIENARAQEKQDHLERTELKMELVRERELRETLERQLSMEQKNRGTQHHIEHPGQNRDARQLTANPIFTFITGNYFQLTSVESRLVCSLIEPEC